MLHDAFLSRSVAFRTLLRGFSPEVQYPTSPPYALSAALAKKPPIFLGLLGFSSSEPWFLPPIPEVVHPPCQLVPFSLQFLKIGSILEQVKACVPPLTRVGRIPPTPQRLPLSFFFFFFPGLYVSHTGRLWQTFDWQITQLHFSIASRPLS